MPIHSPLLRVLWTLLAVVSSFPVLGETIGSALPGLLSSAISQQLTAVTDEAKRQTSIFGKSST